MIDLAPEMVDLLRAAVAHDHGVVCPPGQVQKLWPLLSEAKRLRLITFLDQERPIINDMGRRAIGAPPGLEADYARLLKECRRKPLTPRPDDDPRSNADYQSYRSMGYVCVLVVRQPDPRYNPQTVLVGKTLTSKSQGLSPRNSVILPESAGTPFVLALIQKWLLDRTGFNSCPYPIDDEDASWSADDRATWDRLRNVCMSVNIRIRRGGKHQATAPLHYGEFA